MKWTLNLIMLLHCLWLVFSNTKSAAGNGINCTVECSCCKQGVCGREFNFPDACTHGCIDGYTGARCYNKCPHNKCKTCKHIESDICTACHEGFFNTVAKCKSECLPNCKTCTSGSTCTSCKDEFYNENGSKDCRYKKCPGNCKCENNQCTSCMEGYYDISNLCNRLCLDNCATCSSSTHCDSCKDGYYNGYQSDDTSFPLLNDCTNECRDSCEQCSSYDICSVCKSGLHGSVCEKVCSAGCTTAICDIQTGNCECSPHFAGDSCDKCITGKYGNMCEQQCSTGCNGNVCDKKSGICIDGCMVDTIVGDKCDVCKIGWYGPNCNLSCSVGCNSNKCNRTSGECTDGCLSNYIGEQCNQCLKGKYGDLCNSDCPNNCNIEGCLRETGYCIMCLENFVGEKCDRCVIGLYGSNCSENCPSNCLNNTCNRHSGMCLDCIDNHSGDRCCINNYNCIKCSSDTSCKECRSGYFNDKCDEVCPDNCLNSCNIKTGICNNCTSNFFGDRCNFSCADTCEAGTKANYSKCLQKDGECHYGCIDGFRDFQCSKNCSSNCINNSCNKGDGKCKEGCRTEVADDPSCPLESRQKGDDDDGEGGPVGGIVGGVVGVLVAVAIVIFAVTMYRRRQFSQTKGERTDFEETQPSRSTRNAEQTHTYGNISEKSGPLTKIEKGRKSASIPAAVGRRHSGNDISQPSVVSSSLDINDVEINEEGDDDQNDDPYYNITDSPYKIKVVNLLKYVTTKTIDFEAEFKKLNKDLDLTKHCSVAKQPENIALNRYNGIYPYDHSRVTIPDIPDFFINACYIDGYCKEKEYIASLGPTSKTTANFSSFWLMVWYKKTDIIVMLTNLRETSGMKCEQYWPEAETENVYGEITVKCRSSEEFAEYSVRTYTILKGKERRQVIQLHYTAWPDKGVPQEVTSLVEFRQRVNVVPKTLGGPIIVHCSAGVGRTGTYIGLDTLTKEGKDKGSVDIFECVNKMRYQRVNMVQTAEQYKFLHKALVHSLSFGCETMTAEEIQKIMYEADVNTFSNIYKSLAQEVDTETKDELTAREENKKRHKDKNRRHSGTPGNNSRVRLFLARKEGQHDYINAVFINSFRIKNLFIASQTPLPGTIEDFISMIFQQNTTCVVALEDQNNPSKDIGHYLPADNETYTFGHFSVTSSKNETKSQYILKNLTVKDYAKDQKKSVYHFQYKNWQTSKKVPDNATEFVQFVKEVEQYVNKDLEDQPNIIAHCLNGFERTGLFCIVYKLLEKLEAERQVSVVNTVRKIRTHRRQSITSVEQLKFCFECISAYLETYSTYTNFAS